MSKVLPLFLILTLTLLLFGCTESIPGIPPSFGLWVNQATDLNYTKLKLGDYNSQILFIDWNKLSVANISDLIDCNATTCTINNFTIQNDFNYFTFLTLAPDGNVYSLGLLNSNNVWQIDLNSVGVLKSQSGYLCDASNCYKISDLNIVGTGSGSNYADVNALNLINSLDLNNSLSYSKLDSNWQTSWNLFDANMRATYAGINDVNQAADANSSIQFNNSGKLGGSSGFYVDLSGSPVLYFFQGLGGQIYTEFVSVTDLVVNNLLTANDINTGTLTVTGGDIHAENSTVNGAFFIQSGNNVCDSSGYGCPVSGSSIDTNWETSWLNFDANMRAYFQPLGNYLTVAQGDANYWSKLNNFITVAQADFNYYSKSEVDTNFGNYVKTTDFNSLLESQSCPAGQALRILGATPTCIAVGVSGTDTNWQTSFNLLDANLKQTFVPYNGAIGDVNFNNVNLTDINSLNISNPVNNWKISVYYNGDLVIE